MSTNITCAPTDIHSGSGALELPLELTNNIWRDAIQRSAIMRAARRIELAHGNGVTWPVVTGKPEAAWVGETCAKPVSNVGLGMRTMRLYEVAVILPFSEKFVRDWHGLYREVSRLLPEALAAKFDATVMGGNPVPGSDFDTLGASPIVNLTGKTGVEGILEVEAQIAQAGGHISAWLAEPALRSILLGAAVTNGWANPFDGVNGVGHVLGAPVYPLAPDSMPEPFIGAAGDFANGAVYGTVGGIHISVSDQASLTTLDGTPINLWQQDMIAIKAWAEFGFLVRDPNLFVRIEGSPTGFVPQTGPIEIASAHIGKATIDDETVHAADIDDETVQRETVGNAVIGNANIGNLTQEPEAAKAESGPFAAKARGSRK